MADPEMIEKFIASARRYIGYEYRPEAVGRFGKIDCVHLVIRAGMRCGYLPKDYISPVPNISRIHPELWNMLDVELDRIENHEEKLHGDVVVLYEHLPPNPKGITAQPRHCGILVNKEGHWYWLGVSYAHAVKPYVCEMPFHLKAQERIYRIYRLRERVCS